MKRALWGKRERGNPADFCTPLLGPWGPSTTANITITATGWTYKPGTSAKEQFTDSGTYKIIDTMQGIPHYVLDKDGDQYGMAYVKVAEWDNEGFPIADPNTIELVIGEDGPIELARQP